MSTRESVWPTLLKVNWSKVHVNRLESSNTGLPLISFGIKMQQAKQTCERTQMCECINASNIRQSKSPKSQTAVWQLQQCCGPKYTVKLSVHTHV